MAFTYNFVDNAVYGANDINKVRSTLAYKGVIPEAASSCQVVKNGSAYRVMAGQVLFSDGSVVTVDSNGYDFSASSGSKYYVWFERSEALNNVSLKCTTSAPSGIFVRLAEISASGVVTDAREYGRMKIPTYESNMSGSMYYRYSRENVPITPIAPHEDYSWRLIDTIPMVVDFKYAVLHLGELSTSNKTSAINFLPSAGSAPLETIPNAAVSWWIKDNNVTGGSTHAVLRKNGMNLEVWLRSAPPPVGTALVEFMGVFFV